MSHAKSGSQISSPRAAITAANLSLCFLGACTSIDPQFAALQPHTEKNPPPSAIVGMWHRKAPESISTFLFRADGTAFQKDKHWGWPIWRDFPAWEFKYGYSGNGTWTCTDVTTGGNWDSRFAAPAVGTTFQLAKGHLLMARKNPLRQIDAPVEMKQVFERQTDSQTTVLPE